MKLMAIILASCFLASNVSATQVASDNELASVKGMAVCIQCCYKRHAGDMCYGPPRILADCSIGSNLGKPCTTIIEGPSKNDILVSYAATANLAQTYCKKYQDGICVYATDPFMYCDASGSTPTNGTRWAGTGKKCPWYW
jgi:hypothetical protein